MCLHPAVHIWKTALTARFLPQKPPVTTLDTPAQLWLIASRIRRAPARAPARTARERRSIGPTPRRTPAPSVAACGSKRALARAARRWRGICRRGDDTGLEIARTAAHSSFLVPSCKETRISPALPVWGSTPSRLSHSPPRSARHHSSLVPASSARISHRIVLAHPFAPNNERTSFENESEDASKRPIHIPRGIERASAFEKGPAKKPINRDAGDATMRSRPRRTTKHPSRPPGYLRPAPQRRGGTPTTTPA
ncbi:hypothetical protein HETIRDRAFT_455696 [Heterobasidion irregulare TC 32-1]|uniref:Uncharacterized protein n=1 Tax=Heterobasidion irregulare (strain TC 32-1) TaxID=747525 RepID=W4JSP8_HETIT|nr:uncharacterized protein HETIRDRAFT_455696 [Heterobasidion irregulare TC 32-1]ETW76135.1 hypothetical protein HETIRDRAFT_455696 [Heterobasidion irregulare TC 32-1]